MCHRPAIYIAGVACLDKSRLECRSVAVVNSQVQEGPEVGSKKFEIIASKQSSVEKLAAKKFEFQTNMDSTDLETATEIELKGLNDAAVNEHVTVSVKVVSVEPPVTVTNKAGKELVMQSVLLPVHLVAIASFCGRPTWESWQ